MSQSRSHKSVSSNSPAATASAPELPGVGANLEQLLQAYLGAYERLSLSVAAHREAIKRADTTRIDAIVAEHQQILMSIADLDQGRRSLIAMAMRQGLVQPGKDAKLTDIAAALPEPQASRLVRMALDLRDLVGKVQKDQSSLRLAAGALASHMQGLIQHVARRLSHAGVYSKRGLVEGLVLASALDIRR